MNAVILIPAYRPSDALTSLVAGLSRAGYAGIVVVDDGSGPEYAQVFDALRLEAGVTILRHAVNLGKGAALKTGINHILCEYPDAAGVVTADADGQHSPGDIGKVAAELCRRPHHVVLGTRQFEGARVPLRSRLGNRLTIAAVRLLIGQPLADTQTGLRGLPGAFAAQLLPIPSSGYEFELDMLIACKHGSWPVSQVPIAAIYEPGNPSSHFNPLTDSLRIYFVLLRFGFVSLLTAILDNAVFILAFPLTGSIGKAQILSRSAAVLFNYLAARKAVFLSRENHLATFPRYVALVAASGLVSWGLIQLLVSYAGLSPITAKISAEAALFIANFALQRDFVFRKRRDAESAATDWDLYYREVPLTAGPTRKYTENTLARALREHAAAESPVIVELGGANSSFYDRLAAELKPAAYHVIDSNQHGLDLLARRTENGGGLRPQLHLLDCLDLERLPPVRAGIVYSVGLIEHFDPPNTKAAIHAHLRLLEPGGLLLLTFPTPTWLYRAARGLISAMGMWRFPDERPLEPREVLEVLGEARCEVILQKTLWPLVLTQHLVLARMPQSRAAAPEASVMDAAAR